MRDAITGLIGRYDQLGRYFDRSAIDRIEGYFGQAELRLKAVELINREASELVREASQRLFVGDPEPRIRPSIITLVSRIFGVAGVRTPSATSKASVLVGLNRRRSVRP